MVESIKPMKLLSEVAESNDPDLLEQEVVKRIESHQGLYSKKLAKFLDQNDYSTIIDLED